MQHWDDISLNVQELSQQWDKDSLSYAIFDERITKCMISTLRDDFSQNYFIKLFYELFS